MAMEYVQLGVACDDCVVAIANGDYSCMDDSQEQQTRAGLARIGEPLTARSARYPAKGFVMTNVCVSSEELLREAMRSIPVARYGDTIFIPLPVALWVESSGQCICDYCKADNSQGYWDTMAVSKNPENYEHTWLVHYPQLHREADRRARALEDAEETS